MSYEFPTLYPVTCHTDHVGAGSTFVAIQGMHENGVNYISAALAKGATTIVVQEDIEISNEISDKISKNSAQLVRVANARRALAQLSARALNFPAKKLQIFAITGTKGKTTTTFLLSHFFKAAGYKTAMLSSAQNRIGDYILETHLTTEQPDYLHMFFAECVKQEITHVVMEVAAQAVTLERVAGLEFDGLIFTNFDKEHGEFYPILEDYFAAKCALFKQLKLKAPVFINADDPRAAELKQLYPQAVSYGTSQADVNLLIKKNDIDGICITLGHNQYTLTTLLGMFNAYNLCAAVVMALSNTIVPAIIKQSLTDFSGVPGRLECYRAPNGARCFIDKAHNPSSFTAVLSTLRALTPHLIVVFGAGGDRDPLKRPVMGEIAARWCDFVVITSDNPRSEELVDIINAIYTGIKKEDRYKVVCEFDRATAIRAAYAKARPDSIIALLGKGPDEYELVKGVKTHFSERAIIASL